MTQSTQEWIEEGAHEVAPGVHRLPLPLPNDGLRAVNVYAVADGDGVALIDSGWAMEASEEQLVRSLDSIGYGLGDITRFLVTHAHRDHYTQAAAIRRIYGTHISLGIGEKPSLEWITAERLARPSSQLARLRRFGAEDVAREIEAVPPDESRDFLNWAPPDAWLEGSTPIELTGRTLQAIPTPGHTQGHFVFLDAEAGMLFAGDHVLPHITPSIGFETFPGHSPLGDYLDSLHLMLSLPDVRLLPAHGPVTDSTHTRVDELLEHHAARLQATLDAVHAGASTGREVAARLGWTRHNRRFDDLDVFNRMLAVTETGAHLEVLVERHLLTVAEIDGVTYFSD
jgi:glyoxylase-like metal-dependent hydrolase (beta-lactamase superfamily II)